VKSRKTFIDNVEGNHSSRTRNDNAVNIFYAFNPNITFLPKAIGEKFPNLKTFAITKSGLRYIEWKDFHNLKQLNTISLRENKIDRISRCAFHYLDNLEKIILDGNRIKEIHEDTFMHLPKLAHFSANENDLVHLDADLFSHNPNIRNISLSHNNISSIDIVFLNKEINLNLAHNSCINMAYECCNSTLFNDIKTAISEKCKENSKCCRT
jgi:hypothetical protein